MKYKSFESYTINDLLRKNQNPQKLPSKEREFTQQLDSALSKLPNYEGDLIRTVDFSDYPDPKERLEKYMEQFVSGKSTKIHQYWSTSKEEGYNKKAQVRIYIQNSKNGRDISSIGLDEKEVLYERESEFYVLSKKLVDGIWYVLLCEV